MIELAPSAVRTERTPGQSTREGYMPLDEFIDEVMGLFRQEPTPKEILVERVAFLRWAERDGRFDQAVEMLSATESAACSRGYPGAVHPSAIKRRRPGECD